LLARATALQPEVIPLGEPASALDPITTLRIGEELRCSGVAKTGRLW